MDIPLDAGREAMAAMGVPAWQADALREYFRLFRLGHGDFITGDVTRVTGDPARSYQNFAHDFAAVFGGAAKPADAPPR